MKTINFSGPLATEMTHFIKLKQSSGADYFTQASYLLRFERYLVSKQIKEKIVTRSIFQGYFDTMSHLCARGFSNHYSVLRDFSAWFNLDNPASYVLEKRPVAGRSHSGSAYIFSIAQIRDILKSSCGFGTRIELIPGLYRTLYGILYSTGMRISEALALNHADYIQTKKLIHIRKGKFRKERYVVISNSVAEQLDEYLQNYRAILPWEQESPMFINTRRNRLNYQNASLTLEKVLKKSGINKDKNGPSLHDFRHTFAVHRLIQWYETEKDINAKLPFLSTYMGHVNIASTQVYIQATAELLQAGSERFHQFFLNNIKKTNNN